MIYYLSAFRLPGHKDGYIMAERVPCTDLSDAMQWIYSNMLQARNDRAAVRFEAIADRRGIAEMVAQYEGEWSLQDFDQLNDIDSVIIQREDYASLNKDAGEDTRD